MSNTWRARLYFGFALRLAGFIQEWYTFPFRSSILSWMGYAIIAICAWQLTRALEQQDNEPEDR